MVMFESGEQHNRNSHDVGRREILFNDKERCLHTDTHRVPKGCTLCIVRPQCSKNSCSNTLLLLRCVQVVVA